MDAPTLDAIAKGSGGQDFIVPPMNEDQSAEFRSAINQILALINSGYVIGVVVPPGGTGPTISTPGHPDLLLHTRVIGKTAGS